MIEGKRVLALIPARGGSKGIKDKNITPLCGKPLIAYSVLAAKNSRYIDDVVVTTDSERIAETAKAYGAEVPFLRPAELNVLSMQSTVRRQDMPQYYLVDGSVYVNRIETLSESTSFNDNPIPYIMDAKYSVDIDEPSDLEQAETLLKKYT